MKFSRFVLILFMTVIVSFSTGQSPADTGPKPTLMIFAENLDDDNYYTILANFASFLAGIFLP